MTEADRAALEPRLANMITRPRRVGIDNDFSVLWVARGPDGFQAVVVWRPADDEERRLANLFFEVTNEPSAFTGPVKRVKTARRGDEEHAFIRAIVANREEVTGYLVYADYLTERGDAQGDIIRLSVEIDLMDDWDTRYGDLSGRRDELLAEHGERIYAELARLGLRPEYPLGQFVPSLWLDRRGVIDEVMIDRPGLLPRRAARLFAAAPFLRKLELRRGSYEPAALARVKQLEQVEELDISSTDLTAGGLAALLQSEHLGRLAILDLRRNPLADAGAEAICQWPGAATLTSLRLDNCGLTGGGVAALAACPRLAKLARLSVNAPGATARAAFGSPHLRNLAELTLGTDELSPEHYRAFRTGTVQRRYPACGPEVDRHTIVALRGGPCRRTLRRLELGYGSFAPGAFADFARTELPALQSLRLNSIPLGVPEAECLARAEFRESLTALDLDNCGLGDAGVEALARGGFPRLSLLDLSRNRFGSRGLAALARAAKRFPALRRLKLRGNDLGPEDMAVLARSKLLADLIELDLRDNAIRAAGAVALAGTPYLEHVVALRLDSRAAGKKGRKALEDCFHENSLEFMD
jgi:uncharacterized protein (TIGR02996 family)